MFRVLITDNLAPAGLKILQETPGIEVDNRSKLTPAEVREALKSADGIIIRSGTELTPELLEGQQRLKVIVRAGVGVDNINLPTATREGIVVMNTPTGNTTSTAEHTITMMMALSRNVAAADASMKAGKWDRTKFKGTQLAGKTLAVVGLGRIGQAVAKRAIGLEMKVVGYDPFLSAERAAEQGIELIRDVDEIVTRCDYITVHTPLDDGTRGLINAERIAKMRKGVRIINCARGGIVDETALADALKSGHVAGAALDVFVEEPPPADHPLLKAPNLVLTPHLGASTEEAQEAVSVEAAEIIVGFLIRSEVRHAVNLIPISGAEMADMKPYLDIGYRLGMLLSQLKKSARVSSARLLYRGDAATKKTRLITAAFTSGLMASADDSGVNIVNADMLARERGIEITESSSSERGDFSTLVSATVVTDAGELSAASTIFGNKYLRLVKLGDFHLDAYLDGHLLMYHHIDAPGLIGFMGTTFGKHNVNIAHLALGRKVAGGQAVAVLNLDGAPTPESLAEILTHEKVTAVETVELPAAGAPLPWLISG
ncbi:MAG: phosphoglycerate dehydrogenase [Planctomycetaceae bacterium]